MKKILIIVFSLLLLTGCSNSKKEDTTLKGIKIDVNKNDKIELEATLIEDSEIVVVLKNISNDVIKDASIDLAFFDENDKLVKTEKEDIYNLQKGSKNVVVIEKDYPEVKRIEVTSKVLKESKNENPFTFVTDKVQATTLANGDYIDVKLVNNSGSTIDTINSTLVLYKNNKIVAAYQFYDTNVLKEVTNKALTTTSKSEKIIYDNKEVIINNAYIVK